MNTETPRSSRAAAGVGVGRRRPGETGAAVKVARLPVDPGPAGWNAILPDPAPAEPLGGSRAADWLVIGAGFAGLAAARRIVRNQPGESVVILDAVRVGEGPAGRNSGFMIDLPHDLNPDGYAGEADQDRVQIAANRLAIEFAAEAAEAYHLPAGAFRRAGKINAAATARGLKRNDDFAAHLTALGEDFRMLDAADMRAITGGRYYRGGIHTPGAAMIQPALFVRGVAAGLVSEGVSIHENTPVTGLSRNGGLWRAETPLGRVEAPRAILAVNGHAESFGYFRRRLIHVFTYASMTRRLTTAEVRALDGAPDWGVTPSDPMGTTVRRVAGAGSGFGGDRIVIRNRFTCDPSMAVGPARIAAVGRGHDRSFAARFPMLAGVTMEYRWGGRLCLSSNGAPAFGEVDEGLFSACCQNGLGTVRGTFAGVTAADLATGRASDFADLGRRQPGPDPLPPSVLLRAGATARIRWGEFSAGREF